MYSNQRTMLVNNSYSYVISLPQHKVPQSDFSNLSKLCNILTSSSLQTATEYKITDPKKTRAVRRAWKRHGLGDALVCGCMGANTVLPILTTMKCFSHSTELSSSSWKDFWYNIGTVSNTYSLIGCIVVSQRLNMVSFKRFYCATGTDTLYPDFGVSEIWHKIFAIKFEKVHLCITVM